MKYNDFAGRLPDRRVSDLTPLDRMPCWHLQRDLVVLAGGEIPVCKQDFNCEKPVANIATSTVAEAWEKLRPFYLGNYAGKFDLWPSCAKCDEWYTYNF
jgi:spiro-SPASM protein